MRIEWEINNEKESVEVVDPIVDDLQVVWSRLGRAAAYLPDGVNRVSWIASIAAEVNEWAVNAKRQANAKGYKVDWASVVKTVFNAASVGLMVGDALDLAYLVPIADHHRKLFRCEYWGGYKGFIELGRATGAITTITPEIVWKDEPFQRWNDEDGVHFRHDPDLDRPGQIDIQEIQGAYVISKNKQGQTDVEFVSGRVIRQLGKKGNVWKSHPDAMAKKSAIRRMANRWPQSKQLNALIKLDSSVDDGKDQPELVRQKQRANIEAAKAPLPEWALDLAEQFNSCSSPDEVREVAAAIKAANKDDGTPLVDPQDYVALDGYVESYLELVPEG